MKRIISLIGAAFLYFCVGTVIAITVAAAVLYQKGAFADERLLRMWAALQGVSLPTPNSGATSPSEPAEQPSYEEVLQRRALASLDITLRESALDKSLRELSLVEDRIRTERTRFDYLVQSYDDRLRQLETSATDAAVLETQRTLEALPPKQAKQQLLNLLSENPSPGIESPISSVVALVKAMPIDRRRKILSEFKSVDEEDKLADILKEILRGAPDVPLLQQARDELKTLNGKAKQ
jgi:hypothetical protein